MHHSGNSCYLLQLRKAFCTLMQTLKLLFKCKWWSTYKGLYSLSIHPLEARFPTFKSDSHSTPSERCLRCSAPQSSILQTRLLKLSWWPCSKSHSKVPLLWRFSTLQPRVKQIRWKLGLPCSWISSPNLWKCHQLKCSTRHGMTSLTTGLPRSRN